MHIQKHACPYTHAWFRMHVYFKKSREIFNEIYLADFYIRAY